MCILTSVNPLQRNSNAKNQYGIACVLLHFKLKVQNLDSTSIRKDTYKKLKSISPDSNFTVFRSLLAKLVWTQQSRPDITFYVAILRQVTEKQYLEKPKLYVKAVTKILDYVQKRLDLILLYPRLNMNKFNLRIYSDASFAENTDLLSLLGFIIFFLTKIIVNQYIGLHLKLKE